VAAGPHSGLLIAPLMLAKHQRTQWFGPTAQVGLAAFGAILVVALFVSAVFAQDFGNRRGGSMFQSIFGPFSAPRYSAPVERQVDSSRAPAPRKVDTQPSRTVLVLGDSMADWLAYGLEDAFADNADVGVVRRHRTFSGLISYDSRNEAVDWAQVARDVIAAEKPRFIVMMVGLYDRQLIRERAPTPAPATMTPGLSPPPGTPAARNAPQPAPAAEASRPAPPTDTPKPGEDAEQAPQIAAPDTPARSRSSTVHEFRSERWAELYAKKIDDTIAVLKSRGVPVFWVGLPSVRGPKSTSDMMYLNDLFRARADKAGITYIDVWDGFVDENGRFTAQGPDYEGQTRRLRSGDGLHFTKAGARKLAHYIERELTRAMTVGPVPIVLPAEPQPTPQAVAPRALPGSPTARPLSGPVLPLTAAPRGGEELLGTDDGRRGFGHPSATRVLVKGEAVDSPAGRADDFAWPRRGVAPFGKDPVVATTNMPIPVMQPLPAQTTVPVPTEARAIAQASAPAAQQRRSSSSSRQQQRQQQQYQQRPRNDFFPFFR